MNSLLMVIVAVFIILLVFIMFSMDDREEASEDLTSNSSAEKAVKKETTSKPEVSSASETYQPDKSIPNSSGSRVESVVSQSDGEKNNRSTSDSTFVGPSAVEEQFPKKGGEDDFWCRQSIEDQFAPVTRVEKANGVLAVLQMRFPESLLNETQAFTTAISRAESILDPAKVPFPHNLRVVLLNQTSHLWLFGLDSDADDPVFEGVLTALNVVFRFKKAIESDSVLLDAKARLAVGMSAGEIIRIQRSAIGLVTYAGKALFMAETLSQAAGDFQILLDESLHRSAQAWFDFREWKPIKLWHNLPPIAFYELVGWNKKEEIFANATHKDASFRRAVAVAYRYLEFEDLSPLLSLLSDPDERVALQALDTLAEIKDDRAMGILKKILPEAKTPQLRSAIIKAMGTMGREEVIPILLASIRDMHWQVRYQAVRAIYAIAGSEALRHIEHLTKDEDGSVRACVHEIFYRHDKDARHLNALRELMGDLSIRARKAAAESLASIGTRESLHILASSYFDQEPDIQRFILRQLRDARSPDAYECFLYIFRHADDAQRPEIISALRRARLG